MTAGEQQAAPAGMQFGRWTVMGLAPRTPGRDQRWNVRCECGTERSVIARNLRNGESRSCGCLSVDTARALMTTHGYSGTPTSLSWRSMRSRCYMPSDAAYPEYGGRGITVCERWSKFENFLADMGERPEGKTLDRIDNDKRYEPGNCRWATPKEQTSNRRTTVYVEIDGVRKPRAEWARIYGKTPRQVTHRIRSGWDPVAAITTDIAERPRSRDGRDGVTDSGASSEAREATPASHGPDGHGKDCA